MKYLNCLLFLTYLWIAGCSTKQNSTKKESVACESDEQANSIITYQLDNVKHPQPISLSEIGIDDIEYVPLETNDKCLISNVRAIKYYKDKVLLITWSGIFMFTTSGSFIAKIGNAGKGPKEYLNAHDVDFFPSESLILVLSAFESKFYCYDYKGNFVKTIPAPEKARDFICSDSTILCYSENFNGDVVNSFNIIDSEGNIIKSFANKFPFKIGKIFRVYLNEISLYKNDNKIYFKEALCDTIFEWKDTSFRPVTVIDRGGLRVPISTRIIPSPTGNDDVFRFVNDAILVSMKNYIFYNIGYKKEEYNSILYQKDGKSIVRYTKDGLINDIDGGPDFKYIFKINDKMLLNHITPLELKDYVALSKFKNAKVKYPDKKKKLEELANSLQENDNAVLIYYRLKE